jgi:hypothetical protein
MPSSTSNSNTSPNSEKDYYFHENRPIPDLPWKKAGLIAALIMVFGVFAWEYNARVIWGYPAGHYIDNKGLWAIQRNRIDDSDENTVAIIGSSRILFDLDLDTYEKATSNRPIQLALVGTNPRPLLKDLANDADFKGLLIVGITPGSFFRHSGGLFGNNPEYYEKESPTQWLSQQISMLIEPHLAFYDNSNMALFTLIERVDYFENSVANHSPVSKIWELSYSKKDRNTKMFWKVEDDLAYQHNAQMAWRNLMQLGAKRGPAPFDHDAYMLGVVADVNTIRSRGGDVVFVRTPSSGDYRPGEAKNQPRDKFWDRLLTETNSVGVHFEDHAELQGFRIPEWSHLHSEDAPKFTEALVPILNAKLKAVNKKGIMPE